MNLTKTFSAIILAALAAFYATPTFADITNVVETGGDNEATDTITAKWTGVTYNTTIDNEPINGVPAGTPYTVGTFGHLSPAFVDRRHAYTDAPVGTALAGTIQLPADALIPSYLLGGEYIMSGNDNRDNPDYRLDVTVDRPASVFMLIDNRLSDGDGNTPPTFDSTHMQWILDEGWFPLTTGLNRFNNPLIPDEVGIDEDADGSLNQFYSVYFKEVPAGTFTLKQADNSGQNMYGVVVVSQPAPEPGSLALAGLSILGGLGMLRRRSV
ncbi:MAG: PEP-CTERM sorting domain-containing protein [Planctomycetales bacterium]|nr:PEP-CTERM sorting domain-containing protein [Planctomycetales bacterium]